MPTVPEPGFSARCLGVMQQLRSHAQPLRPGLSVVSAQCVRACVRASAFGAAASARRRELSHANTRATRRGAAISSIGTFIDV